MNTTTTPTIINVDQTIQKTKLFLCRYFIINDNSDHHKVELNDEAHTVIDHVAQYCEGLGSDIAKSVIKYKKMSEKQAYWIAKTAVEQDKITRISHLVVVEL